MGLIDLIGKHIEDIEVVDFDLFGDQERVGELYRFTLSDGTQQHYFVDGGDGSFYGTLFPATINKDGTVEGINASEESRYLGQFRSIKEQE